MSAEVDVLSVLDQAIERERQAGQAPAAQIAARAAVAELIEAGNEWCALMPGLAGGPEFDRLVAAIANVGGAA